MEPLNTRLESEPKSVRGSRGHLRRFIDALQGPTEKTWNEWRKSNRTLRPDLRGLDFTVVDPAQISLIQIDLSSARPTGANLARSHAWQVRLNDADLRYANLDEADLSFGQLVRANLESCRLVRANLSLVNAEGAIFRHANLAHAVLNGARCAGKPSHS